MTERSTDEESRVSPSAANGSATGPAAKRKRKRRRTRIPSTRPNHQSWCTEEVPPGAERCPNCGGWQPANHGALLVGQHSAHFWREADEARRAIVRSVISSAGHTESSAPRTLTIAADALAQATLLRDAAFARIVEAGGPLTSADRTRRAFNVWEAASAAVERYLRLFGRARATTEPTPSLDEWLEEGDDPAQQAKS
jgi:hypothetical protein